MIKIVGAGLLALAGFMAGLGKMRQLRSTLGLLEDMDAAMALMAAEIEFHGRPLPELFALLAEQGPKGTRGFFEIMILDERGVQELWPLAVRQIFGDEEVLVGLGAVLGRYEGDRQAREIELVRLALRDRAGQIKAEIAEKAKNYPALGLCAGAVVGIMVI